MTVSCAGDVWNPGVSRWVEGALGVAVGDYGDAVGFHNDGMCGRPSMTWGRSGGVMGVRLHPAVA